MRNLFLIIPFLLVSSLQCIAAGNAANNSYSLQWQKGTTFYDQKQYDSAAYYFEQIAALKPQNSELYYNLGNTYYRLNKIALAVLNYERALRINPDYKEAKENLMLAQARISNHIQATGDIFFIKWWDSATQSTKATLWAVTALAIFALIIVLLILRSFQKNKLIPVQLPGVLGFLCLCFLVLAFFSAKNSEQNTGAVVMETDAPMMNNELRGKPLTLVPEGTCVKIISKRENWVEVRLPDGRTGWLQQNLLEKI